MIITPKAFNEFKEALSGGRGEFDMTTNEPAFPITESNGANSGMPGMTLRDYFAAKAMQSYLLSPDRDDFRLDQWAAASYDMADAMLKARNL